MRTHNKRFFIILFIIVCLLLMPFIAMQITNEVNWTLFDFTAASFLLFGTGTLCELVMRKVKNKKHRIILCLAILFFLLLIWAELAVGVFGSANGRLIRPTIAPDLIACSSK